jgi:hypothetical protein
MLSELNTDKVCFLIFKARELDIPEEEEINDGSDAIDDGFASVFTETEDSSVQKEIEGFISCMNEDEQNELVALYWLGRGDFEPAEWATAVKEAASRRETSTANYLLGVPALGDQLAEGLALLDLSCDRFTSTHLT